MYLRIFESTIRELLERGHEVEIGYVLPDSNTPAVLERLSTAYSGCRSLPLAGRRDFWKPLLLLLRHSIDYLRYLDPQYARAPKLARRARNNLPLGFSAVLRAAAAVHPWSWRGVAKVLRTIERLIPPDSRITAALTASAPDLVAVSPLVDPSSDEVEYLKAAQALGYPTVYCVASWDNLTNKGLVQVEADRVTVWNEFMRREAIEMHGVTADRVLVTGAPLFDQWFTLLPTRTREQFFAQVGLPLRRINLLYLCSSGFIAQDEVAFVHRWLAALRAEAPGALREAGVLIRPHPANAAQWQSITFPPDSAAVVWPRFGAHPMDDATRSDYFESMYHSDLVIGLNTSGMIEAGIVGKPVFTVLDPVFADTQGGTLHFHYLVDQGLLSVASDLSQHFEQMTAELQSGDLGRASRMGFLEAFVRPHGLTRPCTPLLAAAIEATASVPGQRAVSPSLPRRMLRLALAPIAWACSAAYSLREAGRTAR